MRHVLLAAASPTELFVTGLVTAIPTSIITVAVSWLAVLRRKVEARVDAQVALQLERDKDRFKDQLQRRRELVMRAMEKEMLERLDEIMGSAYRARNTVRELAVSSTDGDSEADAQLLEQLAAEGSKFRTQIMENRIRLSALSSFDEAHALKDALLAAARAARAGDRDDLVKNAALVELCFQRFDSAINTVILPDPPED